MTATIRIATPGDAEGVAAIYDPLVLTTAITFEIEPPGPQEIAERMSRTLETHPWLVCADDTMVRGYAYASQYRARAAYAWCAEVSVYVHPDHRGRGLGRALYGPLLSLLAIQGFRSLYAGITLPNPGSVGLHESFGFEPLGVFRAAGFKDDRWCDVGWWQRIAAEPISPKPPIPFALLASDASTARILEEANREQRE